jgi:hypothetical protein
MLKVFAVNVVVRWREWRTLRALRETPHASARRLLLMNADSVRSVCSARMVGTVNGSW